MKTDFADCLSPILVKELRQGMRSRVFLSLFLMVQGLMMFNTLIALFSMNDPNATGFSTGLFWTMLGLPMLLFMPMLGLGSVSKELSSNTMELVFLTRLSARRILAGKWVALLIQTALLVSAVLPYLVLRYFSGGVNLAQEMGTLGWMLLVSTTLTAFTVGVSPFQSNQAVRIIMLFGIIFGLIFGLSLSANTISRGHGPAGSGSFGWPQVCMTLFMAALFIPFALEIGVSKIAPPAENHSTRKRLLLLIMITALVGFGWFTNSFEPLAWTAICFFAIASIGSLCELPSTIPSVYQPFVKRGFFGRLALFFFAPGWPSAVIFSTTILSALFGLLAWIGHLDFPRDPLILASIAGSLYFPSALARFFTPRTTKGFVYFLAVIAVSAVLYSLTAILHQSTHMDLISFACILPPCGLLASANSPGDRVDIVPVLITTSVSFLILLFRMRKAWVEINAVAEKARSPLQNNAPHGL